MESYYSFLSKGLLTEEALDKAGRKNRKPFSNGFDNDMSKRLGLHILDETLVSKAQKMSVVYTAICSFENTVREFISKKLLEVFGEEWWSKGVPETVRQKAENRKKEEEKNRWHGARSSESLIKYTEFGDLPSIMNKNWPLFEPHLTSLEWAKQIIRCLERSRNVIMHSAELSVEDIERVGAFIRDWIRQVGA